MHHHGNRERERERSQYIYREISQMLRTQCKNVTSYTTNTRDAPDPVNFYQMILRFLD